MILGLQVVGRQGAEGLVGVLVGPQAVALDLVRLHPITTNDGIAHHLDLTGRQGRGCRQFGTFSRDQSLEAHDPEHGFSAFDQSYGMGAVGQAIQGIFLPVPAGDPDGNSLAVHLHIPIVAGVLQEGGEGSSKDPEMDRDPGPVEARGIGVGEITSAAINDVGVIRRNGRLGHGDSGQKE